MLRKPILIFTLLNIVLLISVGRRLDAREPDGISHFIQLNGQIASSLNNISANSTTNSTANITANEEKNLIEEENLIDFDTLALCQTLVKSIVLRNTKSLAYTIDTAIITGVDKDNFSIQIKPIYPTTVNPGGSYSFAIAYGFGPNSPGNKSARLEIFADSRDVPLKIVNLKCYVESFDYQIMPASINFGTVPAFSSKTKTITFENQSKFDITYRIEYSNDPAINLSAVSGTITAFGTNNIDVTVRSEQPVNINESLKFILESLCTDTTFVNISAEFGNNEPIVTDALDFGEIVLCESSRKYIKYENTLDVPLRLDSIEVSGPDNKLFSVQNFIGPVVIEPDSTYYHEVLFVPKSSFAGIKNATAVSYISYESVQKNYATELTGNLSQSLSFSELEIDFGDIDVGGFAEKKLVVSNTTGRTITVNGVVPFVNSQIFLLSPVVTDSVLAPGDWIEFTIQFLPDHDIDYLDTLWLSITDGDCNTDLPVSVAGRGRQNLNVWIPSISTEIGLNNFVIPIKYKINISKSSLINVSFDIQVNLNSTIFEPYGMTNGFVLVSNVVVGNERILVIRGDGVTMDGTPKTLTAIRGRVLLSDYIYTPVEIKSFAWSEDISSTVQDGELSVRPICYQQLGLIQSFSLSKMNVYKDFGGDDLRIKVSSGETGRFELYYIDLLGRIVQVASWHQGNNPDATLNEFVINTSKLYGNVYNIWLRTPTASLSRLITIVR